MKVCTKCNIEKPFSEFYKQSRNKNGLQPKCKSCDSKKRMEWHKKHRDESILRNNQYYLQNRDAILERQKKYRDENPELSPIYDRSRKARIVGAEGHHNQSEIKNIFSMQRGLCANCSTKLFISGKQKFHVDHISPLSRGGSNWPSNLQCLCPTCNLRKHAKDPIAWAKENGRLL